MMNCGMNAGSIRSGRTVSTLTRQLQTASAHGSLCKECILLGADVLQALKVILRVFLCTNGTTSATRREVLYTTPLVIQPRISSDASSVDISVRFPSSPRETSTFCKMVSALNGVDAISASQGTWVVADGSLDGSSSTTLVGTYQRPSSGTLDDLFTALEDASRLFSDYSRLPLRVQYLESVQRSSLDLHAQPYVYPVNRSHEGEPATVLPQSGGCGIGCNVSIAPGLKVVFPHQPMDDPVAQSGSYQLGLAGAEQMQLTTPTRWGAMFPPHRSLKNVLSFAINFLLNYRFYVVFMARTTFQAIRPLLAFCVFGEVMKLALAVMSSGLFVFCFSFVLAFEVLYFFLQCYISYVFLGMFFTAAF